MSVPTSSGQSTPWTEKPSDLAKQLETDLQLGLSQQLAEQRLLRLGPNHLTEQGQRSARSLFLSQFTDFMIIVLIIAAIVSGVVGDAVDALVIVVIILINAIIGFSQEYRAERALAALRALSTPDCKVRRDGHVHTIATEQLVTGDLVLLEAGDYVPADCRLVDVADVHVDESALTGESTTVSKVNNALENENLVVADRKNMVFRGTLITHGRAVGLVTATGMSTEMGKVAELLNSGEKEKTPLQVRIKDFGRRLAIAVLLICGVLMAMGILRGEPVMLMFLTAISLAVAAIPEALPAVITVVLGLGAKKMVQQNALVRKLPAVETLGSTTVICSDKTGTLTQNKMHVEECVCVSGARNVLVPADAARGAWALMGQALALSNDVEKGKDGSPNGDPTEVAAYQFAANAGYKKEILSQLFPRVLEIPFESNRKRMTTFHVQEGGLIAFTKGAPEKVLAVCRYQLGPEGVESLDNDYFLQEAEGLAENGYRVLGYAYRNWNTLPDTKEEEEVENDLVFLGLVAMMDPPRPEAAEAVKLCKEAGIRPIMITGDHPATALAIAQRLGICEEDAKVMTGSNLAQLSSAQIDSVVPEYSVFARVSPQQKISIVRALQKKGEFVAMTGDGVNDAPALKRANIGVAMGLQGTDVAREAADMVLLDDNFATIVAAVKEGRRLFDNIRKFIKYSMTSNSGEIWTLMLAPILGLPIPLLPIHILWVNLVTDGLPGLTLAMEKAERNLMQRPPRPPKESIFSHGMWQHILWIGLLIGFLSLFAQAWALNNGGHWQTIVFTVLTFSQLVHALSVRSERESLFSVGVFSNLYIIAAIILTVGLQMAVIYLPVFNVIFHTQPLSMDELMVCFTLPWFVLLFVELEKWMARRGFIYRD